MPVAGENKAVTAAAAVAVALAAGVALMQVRDPWLLVPWMLVAVLAVQPGQIVPRKVTWTDGAMAAVWVWSLAQMALTVNPLPTLFMALMQTAAMAAYLLARRTRPGALTAGVAAAGTVAALIVAGSFVVFRRNVLAAGFGSVYDFRFLFHPMHIHCNMLASAMLACSGVVLAGMPEKRRGWRIAAAALMWMAVALTFSRGAWLAMAVTWVGLMVGVRPLRLKLAIGVALLVAVLVVAAACPAETRTALSMASTQSQQLSARARLDGASGSAEAFAPCPLQGYFVIGLVLKVLCGVGPVVHGDSQPLLRHGYCQIRRCPGHILRIGVGFLHGAEQRDHPLRLLILGNQILGLLMAAAAGQLQKGQHR